MLETIRSGTALSKNDTELATSALMVFVRHCGIEYGSVLAQQRATLRA